MKKIEALRRMYGEEDWLHSQGAEQVHAVLGIEKSDPRSVAEIVAQRLADEERRQEDINKFVEQASLDLDHFPNQIIFTKYDLEYQDR